jgi:hypothetical protein
MRTIGILFTRKIFPFSIHVKLFRNLGKRNEITDGRGRGRRGINSEDELGIFVKVPSMPREQRQRYHFHCNLQFSDPILETPPR